MRTTKKIFLLFFIWRLLIFIPLYFSRILFPYRPGFEYTNLWYYIKPYFPINSIFLYPWANFDGIHYLTIAGNGYTNNARFFPFYPILIYFFSKILGFKTTYGGGQFFVALLIGNFFFLASLIIFYRLINLDYSKKIATWSLIFLLFFPTSFFFANLYTESLFLFLSLLSLFFARKKNWLYAGITGLFLTITRPVGIVIFLVLLYEFFSENKKLSLKMMSLFTVPLGIIGYAIFNIKKWGDALYFLKAHGELGNSRSINKVIFFPQTIFRYFRILITIPISQHEWFIALIELITFIFIIFMLFIAWKKKLRLSYIIFSLLCFLIPASSGTFSGLPRYAVVLFPIFITMAKIESKLFKTVYLIISPVMLIILLMLFCRGYFIS